MRTLDELERMPISLLRGIDIQTKEEEEMVQSVLNKKQEVIPVSQNFDLPSSATDNLTPGKEAELQAEIDAKKAAYKAQFVSQDETELISPEELPVEPIFPGEGEPEVTPEVVPDLPEEVALTEKQPFCQFCDALGPIKHKNNCTKPR